MQQEIEATALFLLVFQDLDGVLVGVAGVDTDGQASQAGSTDLTAKHLLLHVVGRAIVKIIKARLADTDDFRM